jgi:crotonobetainyl-CoA:carnitine CoA-transferase CaiB-like acyl-CoA transferase
MAPLERLRILDFGAGIAGGYTSKLLADAGADVVHVEPPAGDPLREWSASGESPGALFAYLRAGQRSVVGSVTDPEVAALAAGADVVIDTAGPGDDAVRRLREAHRHLSVVAISPFGLEGPAADQPADEFTIQALCGSTGSRGVPDKPPTYAAGRLAEWYCGPYAATAAVAAWRQARAAGAGVLVDLSMLEVACLTMNQYTTVMWEFFGRPAMPAMRYVMIPCVEPTRDGWVGFSTITGQQFQDFLVLIEAFDLLDDAEIASHVGRLARAAEILPRIRAWTERHTTAEIVELATALRIPVAPVGRADTVTTFEHFVEREVYGPRPGGFVAPRPPYRIEDVAGAGTHGAWEEPAPALGAESGAVDWEPRRPAGAARRDLPLQGVRVLDFTMFWAGPSATHALAALGADVVKVESVQRADGMRYTAARGPGTDRWWEWGWLYHGINANKRGITLDLSRHEGRAIAERLVEGADVVIENFTPRVMENFGLGWDRVHEVHPGAVMVRMPGFGLTGPWRDWTGWANTMEQVAGLAWISGWPDTAPWIPNGQLDPVVGWHAAFAVLVALEQRERDGGTGRLVELPMVEVGLNLAAEQVVEWSLTGARRDRDGNHGPEAAPQGCYPCEGSDEWVAISVADDAQWAALRRVMGDPAWARDASLATHPGRRAARVEIDARLSEWTAGCERDRVVADLAAAGVPAAAVRVPSTIVGIDQLRARGFFEPVAHPVTGEYEVPTVPFRWSGIDRWVHRAAPTLGQHTDEVLAAAGVDADTRARLATEGVTGTHPAGA